MSRSSSNSNAVLPALGSKKVRELEETTGRRVTAAVAVSGETVEFVTPQHEHFLFDRKRQTFYRVADDEADHREPLCR